MPSRKIILNKGGESVDVHYETEEEFISRVKVLMDDFPKLRVHPDHSVVSGEEAGEDFHQKVDWDSKLGIVRKKKAVEEEEEEEEIPKKKKKVA